MNVWDTFRIAAKTGKTRLSGQGQAFLRAPYSMFPIVKRWVQRLSPPVQIPRSINLKTRRMIRISSRCLLVLAL
ncbi:hypothetical protein I307_00008 [Cryptococcus deuterogattii 99/473]|uniref:Uncharacterized protein n=1 Tax=Cryptococcus deuterogattii Ram5 TaxID=1296110 RepID=A0A0D0VBW7_9TREE|nr:hypothetical protein I313_00795 [Cryptococcus deuterogattii Ram5]KIY60209.1 hypothetical protein I307_00008 [Cryptococcus deuterogattii 99/473]